MADPGTTPYQVAGLGVRALRVDVIGGVDTGASAVADETLAIGTAGGNELVPSDPTVSRYHLELSRVADGVQVADCGSTNGTRAGEVRL